MYRKSTLLVMSCALAIGAALMALGQGHAEAQKAKISALLNDVQHRMGAEGAWLKSKVGSQLPADSRVRTARGAKCQITFPNGSVIRMGERSDLVIRKATSVELAAGQLYAKIVAGTVATVKGAAAVASVKGTTLQVDVAEAGTTVLTVGVGEVEFFNDLGSVIVQSSQQSTAEPGKAPSRPIVVDPSSLLAWEASLQTLIIELEYPAHVSTDPAELEQELTSRQEAVQQRPEDAAAHAGLAEVLLDLGRAEEAQAAAEKAVELAPNEAAYQGVLGCALLQAGRSAEARDQFSTAAEGQPDNLHWQLGLALVSLVQGEREPAVQQLQRAAEAAPNDPLPRAYLAAAHLRSGDLASADAAASEAVRLGPEQHLGNAYLAYVRLVQGQLDESVSAAATAVQAAPQSALAHEALGTASFFAGDLPQARQELELALELNPLSASGHLTLAKLTAAEDDIEAALEEAQLAVGLDPDSAPARSTLGLLLLLNNDPQAAGREFEQALTVDPNLAEARTGWGLVLARRGQFREAFSQQKAAVSLDTDSASAHNNLGGVYAASGEMESAIEQLNRAIELQPGWGMPYANLALVHLEENRYPEALAAGERALELGERSPFVHTVLARIYMRQGRTDRALAQLRQAVALDEDYPQARFQLAKLYLGQDRARDAMREILTSVAADPSAMVETRRYARTENTLSVGSDEQIAFDARHSDVAAEGCLSYALSGLLEYGDGYRAVNQDHTEKFLEVIGGHQSRPTQQLVFLGTLYDRTSGAPGPVTAGSAGDPDDRQDFTGCDAVLAYRQRLSPQATGTVKYSLRHNRFRFRNPDSLTGGDTSPFRELVNEETAHSPEVRIEADLDETYSLRAGYSHLCVDRDRHGVAGAVDPATGDVVYSPFATGSSPDTDTAWIEARARVDDRLSLLAGGYWGRTTGSSSVALPKLVVLYRPDAATWLSFVANPIFRSDISELAPVEALASPWGLGYLDFSEGGAGRSYELRCQRQGSRSTTLTASLSHQRVRGLLVDVQDPELTGLPTRVLMDSGRRWMADAAYEQWLTDTLTGRVWLCWQSSEGEFQQVQVSGTDWPYAPEWQAGGRLDYIDANGWRIGLEGTWVGRRYHDPQNTQRVGDYPLINLRIQHQRDLHQTYFLDVMNLTNCGYETFAGFPQSDRAIYGGVEYRY
jgi:tetratricopeptide (TPR) repeat protein